ASLLVHGLSDSDAPYVFKGHLYGVLYGFDLNLWMSNRSAAVIFEALDTEAMVKGFDLYFRAIGFGDNGTDDHGRRHYTALRGLLPVSIVPLEQHVALVVGGLDEDTLSTALKRPGAERALFGEL